MCEVTVTTQSAPAAEQTMVSLAEETPVWPRASSSAAPSSVGVGSLYERFLEMPVALVLVVMCLAGVALIGLLCALTFYLVVSGLI